MFLQYAEGGSDTFANSSIFIPDLPVEPNYAFFVDILIQLHCNPSNIGITKASYAEQRSNITPTKGNANVTSARTRRGVMENIVSAYTDIFTKGYDYNNTLLSIKIIVRS